MYFIQTTDVELTSIPLNLPVPEMAEVILKVGLPRLLDLYSKYDVEGTFFFTGDIVEREPEVIDITKEYGHEIGSHGYSHFSTEGFDLFPLETQIDHLRKSKKIIEKAGGGTIKSFRSPEARICEDTIKALERSGFEYDSSVCPQRFDGPLSYGFKQKKKWLLALRRPYRMSYQSFVCEGSSNVIEFPIGSFIFPFIGTTMRVTPKIHEMLKNMLFFEAKKREIPIVFLFHPNECVDAEETKSFDKKYIGNYDLLFSGNFRTKLKLQNLGIKAISLMGNLLRDAKKNGFEFISIRKYAKYHLQSFSLLDPP